MWEVGSVMQVVDIDHPVFNDHYYYWWEKFLIGFFGALVAGTPWVAVVQM